MGKANISFPDGMLEQIDRLAEERDTSRSGLVQEAIADYVARIDHDAERRARGRSIHSAQRRMAEIGRSIPPGPDGVTVIRRMRDAVPEWLEAAERDDE